MWNVRTDKHDFSSEKPEKPNIKDLDANSCTLFFNYYTAQYLPHKWTGSSTTSPTHKLIQVEDGRMNYVIIVYNFQLFVYNSLKINLSLFKHNLASPTFHPHFSNSKIYLLKIHRKNWANPNLMGLGRDLPWVSK